MSSPPSLPVQQPVPSLELETQTPHVMSPVNSRPSTTPTVPQLPPRQTSLPQPGPSSLGEKESIKKEIKSSPTGPPKFEVGTRVIGQRADELWYPGVIEKILTDKHNQTKYKVKFDKGTRGLLSSNHISLESNPNPSVLNVGSRVVALRPRDTAEENASWRKPSTGIYGKLDVLYAGIVAENACGENKNRYLVFFDDGFAQYLPVKKLHHVYHTGKKVWDEVAEHSKEFIQEYLEEFPNRPMVKLKVHQWVKTEWRGQWLKAKVMQLDSSLVKMLFQIDNRSEWLYRGSTRLEPLYSALVDGKISTARKKRSRKLTRGASSGKPQEPFIDYSITKPCFGISPYSKSDPLGEQQRKLEEKRQQTQLEQQRQQEQQEQLRQDNNSFITTSAGKVPSSSNGGPTSTVTTASNTGAGKSSSSDSGFVSSNKGTSKSSLSGTETSSGLIGKQKKDFAGGSGTEASGSLQINSANLVPGSGCIGGGHCVTSPGSGRSDDFSASSVTQTSVVRKKTSGGLVSTRDLAQRSNGIQVIDLDGDGTTAMLRDPMDSSQMMSPKYLVPYSVDGSNLDELYNSQTWEAPWLRAKNRDVRSVDYNRVPAFQIPTNDRRKQDAATLIAERLKQHEPENRPVGQGALAGLPVPRKQAPKGPHKCSKPCNLSLHLEPCEIIKHNPRAVPLLLRWKREIAQRHPGNKRTVYYRTPCNKRLRSMAEVANYLTITEATNVSIDQFTFDPDMSCQDTVFRDVREFL
ncbi:uncharacterized protein LOC111332656 [Stylophora pistillata]|uniref:uncharacterized protein LOC111332656 n=1 Tax=Stylophora pistillata TaxID=50429 RepID=UPI000C041CD1|nr:uncharacterized protein LOC111332656 [Stylophora pistillata]